MLDPLLAQGLVGGDRDLAGLGPPRHAAYDARKQRADHEDGGGGEQQAQRARRPHELPCPRGPNPGTQAAAHSDERKEPLALLRRKEIIGEGPELRDHHDVEDADPEEIGDSDVQAGLVRKGEQQHVRDEEQRHPRDQSFAIHLRGERAVGGTSTRSSSACQPTSSSPRRRLG
jgi:hypothetical protein